MTDERYAPPTANVEAQPDTGLDRPAIVVLAVRLLWAGFGFTCVMSVYYLAALPARMPSLARTIAMASTLVGLGIAAAISYALFTAAWRGKGWARWVIAVLIVLAFGAMAVSWSLLPAGASMPWVTLATFAIRMTCYSSAVVMLFSPTANAWYRERKRWL